MNALIVYAHLDPHSFNAAMKDRAAAVLTGKGWQVEVSDLYRERFTAVADRADFTMPTDSPHFGYVHEQRHATAARAYAADILREQDRVVRADLLLFQFPLWWYAPPAIVKGWADRVLTHGFAYTDEAMFDKGLLRGKCAMLAITTGGTREELDADAEFTGSVEAILRPFGGGVLQFTGMRLAQPFVAYAPASRTADERERMLEHHAVQLAELIDTLG